MALNTRWLALLSEEMLAMPGLYLEKDVIT